MKRIIELSVQQQVKEGNQKFIIKCVQIETLDQSFLLLRPYP